MAYFTPGMASSLDNAFEQLWRCAPAFRVPRLHRHLSTRHRFRSTRLERNRRRQGWRLPLRPPAMAPASAPHLPAPGSRLPSARVFNPPTTVTAEEDGFGASSSRQRANRHHRAAVGAGRGRDGGLHHAAGYGGERLGDGGLRWMWRVPSTIFCTFSMEPDDSLMPMRLGCSASSMTTSAGISYPVACGKL